MVCCHRIPNTFNVPPETSLQTKQYSACTKSTPWRWRPPGSAGQASASTTHCSLACQPGGRCWCCTRWFVNVVASTVEDGHNTTSGVKSVALWAYSSMAIRLWCATAVLNARQWMVAKNAPRCRWRVHAVQHAGHGCGYWPSPWFCWPRCTMRPDPTVASPVYATTRWVSS